MRFDFGRGDFSLLIGVEYSYLRLSENSIYDGSVGEVTSQGSVFEKSRSAGFGPQVGFGLNYEFLQGWGDCPGTFFFRASGSGSLLATYTKKRANSFLDGVSVVNVQDDPTWRLVPALHARLGFDYETCVCGYDSIFGIGYEFNSYIRGLSRTLYSDDVADALISSNFYNFDVQGLYLSAAIRF